MRFLLILILLFSCVTIPAQQTPPKDPPPQQEPTAISPDEVVRITTNLVQVDAVITDKDGKQVTDLRADEVEILEDRKPRKITNFAYVSLESGSLNVRTPAGKEAKSAVLPPPIPLSRERVRRAIALVVDDLGLSFDSVHFVRQALKSFVEREMQPDDLVAIIRTSSGVGALQQFTNDKRQLLAAIERVKWRASSRGGTSAFAPIGSDPRIPEDSEDVDEVQQLRDDMFTVGTLGALGYVVRGLKELPGRKSVVLLSNGFAFLDASDPLRNARTMNRLRALIESANRASVVIHTMDARGLQTLGFDAADSTAGMSMQQVMDQMSSRRRAFHDSQAGMGFLAEETGGLAFRNNNDLSGGLKRVVEDQNGYYLIGYRPDPSVFESERGRRKFHNLSLRVLRPGKFTVRMRNGFMGIAESETVNAAAAEEQALVRALVSPFNADGVHLRLSSLFIDDPQAGSIMRSWIHIDAKDLTFTEEADGWQKAVFDVLAITFGETGEEVDQIHRTHTLRLRGQTFERIRSEGLVYQVLVPVKKPGAYQLRTALKDVVSKRIGSASQFIQVPDLKKNRLSMSGIVLVGMTKEVYQKLNAGATEAELEKEQIGTVLRQFPRGHVMAYNYNIYNARVDKRTGKLELTTQLILFRNGKPVFTGQPVPYDRGTQTDVKRLPASGALHLGTQLLPGEYVLQIIVSDHAEKDKRRVISEWIDFEITN